MWLRARIVIAALLAVSLCACSSDQSLVLVGGDTVDAKGIDSEPLNLLPSGALMVGRLDAGMMFRSNVGAQVAQIVANVLPLGPESNFSPVRDVRHIYGAAYAMQGADFVAVLQGNFDVAAIERSAQTRARTPSGVPLVATRYGDYTIYTVANVGFVPLTAHTILSGNETGMRRALDRLRFGQLKPSLAPWMHELFGNEKAAFTMLGDVSSQGVVAAAGEQLPFVRGLTLIRVLGNFAPPGMNVVGSLTYADESSAAEGAVALKQLQQLAYLASVFATWGFGGRMPELDARQQGTNVAFATKLDDSVVGMLMKVFVDITSPTPSTAPTLFGG